MKFQNPAEVEMITWEMRLADYPRGQNRSRINDLANGVPPYTDTEVAQNNIATNVNFLELTKITHDARRQFYNAHLTPNPLFTVDVDYGPAFKRRKWGTIITKEINKIIKGSLPYMETLRSTFASVVLHGVGPTGWLNNGKWMPLAYGPEDIFVPSNTLLSMDNLPFFAIFKQFTAPQLIRMTQKETVDKGWNQPLVKKAIKWVDEQARTLMSASWPEVWSPEKMSERIKSDGGLYASDAVPTVDCFDFYYWDDTGKTNGWRRRMILDAWGDPGAGGIAPSISSPTTRNKYDFAEGFLYDSGDRVYADSLNQIVHWQFGDASSVAPFRYHSVRSLGFLLYAVCHLQNRLRCKFNDSVFESLLQYFRVNNPADMDRLTKIDLIDKGILPEGLAFVKPEERWTIQDKIVDQAMQANRQTMADNSASFTQDYDVSDESSGETATRTMAKVNSTAALVGSMLNQSYDYRAFQDREICRRFCLEDSKDPDVRKFRINVLKQGVPEEAINVNAWDIQPVRVIGQGNKQLQVAIADKLAAMRPMLDPDSQKEVDRIYIASNTDNWDLADRLVPETEKVSDSVHDAEQSVGTLMLGIPMSLKQGVNHSEYIETLLKAMSAVIQGVMATGGVGDPKTIAGLQVMAGQTIQGQPIPGNGIVNHIQILAQDKNEKAKVKEYGDALKELMNQVKAFAQRQQEMMKQRAQMGNGGGGMDPKDAAKIQATLMMAKTKADAASKSHAQRTVQRQLQFEQQMKQDEAKHALELQKSVREHGATVQQGMREHRANLAKTGLETAQNIRLNRLKATDEE